MRKLASVVRVDNLEPIENADAIEKATVGGWHCVTKKGNFSVGDLGVYFEIDSIPPDEDRFRFLWDKKTEGLARPDKFRIKTIRLRGQLSQGLLLPIDEIPEAAGVEEGFDLTDVLSVTKYEPPIPVGSGDISGPWNFECSKTDEPRIQSNIELLDEIRGLPWVATCKLDGTSMTVGVDRDGEFAVAGRNWCINQESDNMYWSVVLRDRMIDKILLDAPDLIFQGELCGPGIQKNLLELKDLGFFVFNIYSRSLNRQLTYSESVDICPDLELKAVPVDSYGDSFNFTLDELLEKAKGKYEGTNRDREGIVIRPRDQIVYSPTLNSNLSFKVINNDFLLKEKD